MKSWIKSNSNGVLILIGMFSILYISFLKILPQFGIYTIFHDDSYFYIKTAYNVSQGFGSTFDLVNLTNGYHPLYLVFLTALSKFVTPLIGVSGLEAVFLADAILFLIFVYFTSILLKNDLSFGAQLFLYLSLFGFLGFGDFGIETRLLLPLCSIYLWILCTKLGDELWWWIFASVMGGAICLTRLDSILFVVFSSSAAVLAYCCKNQKDVNVAGLIKKFVFLFVFPFIFLALYRYYNITYFGHPTTISSWLKFEFPGIFKYHWFHTLNFGMKVRFAACILVSGFCLIYYSNKILKNKQSIEILHSKSLTLIFMNLWVIAYVVVLAVFHRGGIGGWYLALPIVIVFVTVSFFLDKLLLGNGQVFRSRLSLVILFCVLCGDAIFLYHRSHINYRNDEIQMGLWVKNNIQKDARIFQVDGAGFIGYISERSVINGDGLINSWEYQDYLRQKGGLAKYFKDKGIQYIMWNLYQSESEIQIPVDLWNASSKIISISKPEVVHQIESHMLLQVKADSLLVKE